MDGLLGAGIAVAMSSILIFLLIAGAIYVLKAISLFTLAKNNGFDNLAFLAWIPVGNRYLLANMAGDADIFGSIHLNKDQFSICYLLSGILIVIPFVGFIFVIINIILNVYLFLNLYKKIDKENAVIFTILSVLIPIFTLIYLFIKRNTIFEEDIYFE